MFDPYQPKNIPLFEALYGKHLISLGGFDAIDNMFSGMSIQNTKALDIGFGLGGVAFYLREKYQMEIAGVEVHPWMAEHAKELAPELEFAVYDKEGKIPFAKNSFDLAYSKGVLNHVHDKLSLFQNIHSCLKQNGTLVIADWIYPEKEENPPLVKETESSYQNVLNQAGFKKMTFRNDSHQFFSYIENFLKNLEVQRDFIVTHYGEELFSMIKNDHLKMLNEIDQGQKIAVRIVAESCF